LFIANLGVDGTSLLGRSACARVARVHCSERYGTKSEQENHGVHHMGDLPITSQLLPILVHLRPVQVAWLAGHVHVKKTAKKAIIEAPPSMTSQNRRRSCRIVIASAMTAIKAASCRRSA
jgi:hypothetical protein